MGKLFKRGDTYYGDYWTQDRQRVRESLRTKDRKVATARLRAAELGSSGGTAHPPKALATAVDDMVSLKRAATATSYKYKALHLFRVLGATTDINTLTRAQIADYAALRRSEKAERHTIHKELVVLRQALKEAKKRDEYGGSLDVVPAYKAEYEPKRRALTEDEFAALLAAVKPERRTWLMIQAYTGAELGAMRRLTWDHVDLAKGTIQIPGSKTSARFRAAIPLHPELRAWLKKLDRAAPLMAPWKQVAKHLREACDAAGIARATTHDLRRTFGSWLVQGGVDILHVARLLGNSPAVAARVYGQTTDASYAAAIARLPSVSKRKPRPTRVPPSRTSAKRKRSDET